MIYDKISNIDRYQGISSYLDKAIAYIQRTELSALPIGRTQIDGEHVFVNVMDAEAKEEDSLQFEVHKKYMDIQIDIIGTEVIQLGSDCISVVGPYQETSDCGFVTVEEAVSCRMGPGRFVICMEGEPHKPGIAAGTEKHLHKCVVKVAVEA
ncbi:MAG: YhcH/YjgK/YiaL family protein [Lachnospiraceae bacterium]